MIKPSYCLHSITVIVDCRDRAMVLVTVNSALPIDA